MNEEELDDAAEIEDVNDDEIDEDALDDDAEADVDVDLALDDEIDPDAEVVVEVPVAEVPVAETPEPRAVKTGDGEEDEDVLELDEELHPDDVEAPLDALLQERTAKATLEDDEEEVEDEDVDADAPGDVPTKIVPRRPGEFLCSSCFLVLPRNQLADERRMLCRDCA